MGAKNQSNLTNKVLFIHLFFINMISRVRFLIWGTMLFLGLIFSKAFLDKYIILKCPTYICVLSGLLLFYIIFKVAGNTGKWLAKYGKEKQAKILSIYKNL